MHDLYHSRASSMSMQMRVRNHFGVSSPVSLSRRSVRSDLGWPLLSDTKTLKAEPSSSNCWQFRSTVSPASRAMRCSASCP